MALVDLDTLRMRARDASGQLTASQKALLAAAEWGFPGLATETSPSNRATYPAMRRAGAESRGRVLQLVLR